jgi:hypothetical protein
LIANFGAPVTISGASVSTGSGSVTSTNVSGSTVTVNLTGVTSPQLATVTISNVNNGTSTSNVAIPLAVVVGDVNGDRTTNAGDATLTRARSGQTADNANFRSDVNTDGVVNSGDTSIVRGRSGQGITVEGPLPDASQ